MSAQTYGDIRRQEHEERLAQHPRQRGQCSATGPISNRWKPGLRCTDHGGHDYAHYDSSQDVSWTDDAHEDCIGCEDC